MILDNNPERQKKFKYDRKRHLFRKQVHYESELQFGQQVKR